MLTTKRSAKRARKQDWYPDKVYLHFDGPLSRADATALVTSPENVAAHSFLPLITFDKRERRYRRHKNRPATIKTKVRKLAYCSNKDACIFSYYAYILNEKYEAIIKRLQIDDVVIGYRKIGSNIDLALAAFTDIKSRGSCVAFAYDISGFFDRIDHGVLERNWARVLGKDKLPKDHLKVFMNLTRFSSVDRRAALRRLGENPSSKDKDIKTRPLCNAFQFRQLIRGNDGISTNLVVPWRRDYRIPQGTPLSALAANISMIDFDIEMRRSISALGGSYRRYSDDILVIVPTIHRMVVPEILNTALRLRTRRLKINLDKTEEIEFIPGALARGPGTKALQYLGFIFDGQRTLLRSSTLAKYYRRMHRAVGSAKRRHQASIDGKLSGRTAIYKRKLLTNITHLGAQNFITGYASSAHKKLGANGIRKQLSKHHKKLNSILKHR